MVFDSCEISGRRFTSSAIVYCSKVPTTLVCLFLKRLLVYVFILWIFVYPGDYLYWNMHRSPIWRLCTTSPLHVRSIGGFAWTRPQPAVASACRSPKALILMVGLIKSWLHFVLSSGGLLNRDNVYPRNYKKHNSFSYIILVWMSPLHPAYSLENSAPLSLG